MILTLFIILLCFSVLLIIVSSFNNSPVLGIIGYTFLFLLGLVILNGSLYYKMDYGLSDNYYLRSSFAESQTGINIFDTSQKFFLSGPGNSEMSFHLYKSDGTPLSGSQAVCNIHIYSNSEEILNSNLLNGTVEYSLILNNSYLEPNNLYSYILTCDGVVPLNEYGALSSYFVYSDTGTVYKSWDTAESHLYGYFLAITGALGFILILFELPRTFKRLYGGPK